jgi:hypothetical protein
MVNKYLIFLYRLVKISLFLIFLITPIRAEIVFPLDPNIHFGKLENGLTYYIRENEEPKDKAYVKMVIKAGSAMEEDIKEGLLICWSIWLLTAQRIFQNIQLMNLCLQ